MPPRGNRPPPTSIQATTSHISAVAQSKSVSRKNTTTRRVRSMRMPATSHAVPPKTPSRGDWHEKALMVWMTPIGRGLLKSLFRRSMPGRYLLNTRKTNSTNCNIDFLNLFTILAICFTYSRPLQSATKSLKEEGIFV